MSRERAIVKSLFFSSRRNSLAAFESHEKSRKATFTIRHHASETRSVTPPSAVFHRVFPACIRHGTWYGVARQGRSSNGF